MKIKESILDYLSKENIDILYFDEGSFEDYLNEKPAELAIRINEQDCGKWGYFLKRVNECGCGTEVAQGAYHNGVYKFTFSGSNNKVEKEILKRNLGIFLDCLKKKYYTVNPKRKKFSILVKPTHRCNLDCKYCYDKPYREAIKCDMSMEVLDKILNLLSNHAHEVQFIWHGGEPTMVGQEWFVKAYEEVFSKYPMLKLDCALMSNGVNLDKKWMDLFDKYKVRVGTSYNYAYQSTLRCSSQKNEDEQREIKLSKKVEKTIKKYKPGVIDVVTKANYKNMIETYEFYKENGINFSANHVFHTKQTERNGLEMEAREYASEFLKFFKYWLYDKDGISERTAQQFLKLVMGSRMVTCENTDCRCEWIGINPLGEIYPCDRYYPEKYKIGKVTDFNSIDEIFGSGKYQSYSKEVQKRFDTMCKDCNYWFACRGGCNGSAVESSGSAEGVEEFVCEMFKLKFNGVYEILRDVDMMNDELNPHAHKVMIENGFYSVKEIKRFMEENGGNFPKMAYDPENILECSEYQIFRGINFIQDGSWGISKHIDFHHGKDEESKQKNIENKKKDLFQYLKVAATQAVRENLESIYGQGNAQSI